MNQEVPKRRRIGLAQSGRVCVIYIYISTAELTRLRRWDLRKPDNPEAPEGGRFLMEAQMHQMCLMMAWMGVADPST